MKLNLLKLSIRESKYHTSNEGKKPTLTNKEIKIKLIKNSTEHTGIENIGAYY